MGFWNFLRGMFLFDWLFGSRHKNGTPTNHTNNHAAYDLDCDCDHDYAPPRSSGYSCGWDDGHYANEDCCDDWRNDCAHDFDDFDDDY